MIELDRQHLVIMMEAGYVYLGMQRFKEAKQVFEGLCCLATDSEVPVIALGGVAFCQGDFKKAITCYKKALKIDPDSLFAKVYLGEALFFSHEKDKAIKVLSEVHEADPQGAAGDFAKSLLDAIHAGFEPNMKELNKGKKKNAQSSAAN
jgi:tetratricopeptide (TPR) repeat protein